MPVGGERNPEKGTRRQDAGPPRWLLPAGCVAMLLLLGGLVAGRPIGTAVAAWGYLIIIALATLFFCLLAIRQVRRRSR